MESTESIVAEVFNKYFVNIAYSLEITNIHEQEPLNDHMDYTSLANLERFETHPSTHKIKSSVDNTITFSFVERSQLKKMLLQLQNLDYKRAHHKKQSLQRYYNLMQIYLSFIQQDFSVILLRPVACQMA